MIEKQSQAIRPSIIISIRVIVLMLIMTIRTILHIYSAPVSNRHVHRCFLVFFLVFFASQYILLFDVFMQMKRSLNKRKVRALGESFVRNDCRWRYVAFV